MLLFRPGKKLICWQHFYTFFTYLKQPPVNNGIPPYKIELEVLVSLNKQNFSLQLNGLAFWREMFNNITLLPRVVCFQTIIFGALNLASF